MRIKLEVRDSTSDTLITDTARLAAIMSTIYYDAAGTNIVEGTSYAAADVATYAGINTTDYTAVTSGTAGVYYYEYTGGTPTYKFVDGTTAVLFTSIVVPTDMANATVALLGEYKLVISAQAVQYENVADIAAARTVLNTL